MKPGDEYNKRALARRLYEKHDVMHLAHYEHLTNMFFEEIMEMTKQNNKLVLHGLGTFRVKPYKSRTLKNPKTGKKMIIPEMKIVSFRPSRKFKDKVNED